MGLMILVAMTSPFLVVGFVFARKAIRASADRRRWIEDGVLLEGHVVGLQPVSQPDGPDEVAPIVTYRDSSGHARQFTSGAKAWQIRNAYAIGQSVPVRYLASDPAKVELDSFALARTFVGYGVMAAISLAGAAMPFLFIFVYMLWHRRS